jgi:hypothetical protein
MESAGPGVWTEIVPAWLSGIGGILSAILAVCALILAWRTRKGVSNVAHSLNTPIPKPGSSVYDGVQPPVDGWKVDHVTSRKYRLRNVGSTPSTILRFDTVRLREDSDDPVGYSLDLPVTIQPEGTMPFNITRSIVSDSVTVIEVEWETDGQKKVTRYYVD